MIELPENAQHSQGMLRAPVMMAVIAVMISLFPLLFGCSSEGSKDHSDGSRRTTGRNRQADDTTGARFAVAASRYTHEG